MRKEKKTNLCESFMKCACEKGHENERCEGQNHAEEEEAVAEILEVSGEWEEIEVTVDSAMDSVMHEEHMKSVPIKKSKKTGMSYRVANGNKIYNQGERKLEIETEEGNKGSMVFQVTDVKKPLAAVRRLNQGGSGVWLDLESRGGRYIQNMATGKRTKIHMKNEAFVLKLKLKKGTKEVNFVGLEEAL